MSVQGKGWKEAVSGGGGGGGGGCVCGKAARHTHTRKAKNKCCERETGKKEPWNLGSIARLGSKKC